jgi:probable F420-dependent oxidoreductase
MLGAASPIPSNSKFVLRDAALIATAPRTGRGKQDFEKPRGASMKFGMLPVFDHPDTRNPAWVRKFARAMEAEGCESFWTGEHPFLAENHEPLCPYTPDGRAPFMEVTKPDPIEWMTFVAGATDQIRLASGVVILPLHNPILLAKRVATLDALSNGRFSLGVGIGWQREEFDVSHVPYHDRAQRAEDIILALRALWSQSPASYRGQYFEFDKVFCEPTPLNNKTVPIIVGGSSDAAADRAARLGDGYYPCAIAPERLAAQVLSIEKTASALGRDPAQIEVTAWPSSWRPGESMDFEMARAYKQAGAMRLVVPAREAGSTDIDDIVAFIRRYRDEIIARL